MITFERTTSSRDPVTGLSSLVSAVQVTGGAVQLDDDVDLFEKLGLVVGEAKLLLFVPTNYGSKPDPGMYVVWGGQRYVVKHVNTFAPDAVAIYSEVVISQ